MLAGLEHVDEGAILIDDKDVVNLAPRDRDIAMVFQNYALYPHMNVAQNMGFALRMAKIPKAEIATRVRAAAKILDIEDYLERKPRQLSAASASASRWAARSCASRSVFLMDEPLSNLDAKLRVATRAQIAALQRRLRVTTLYVTHDQVEAMTMGDRVAVMKDGVLQQCDTPRVLYDSPANAFVAGFIGSPPMNLVAGTMASEGAMIGSTVVKVPRELQQAAGTGRVTIGLRPEAIRPGRRSPGNTGRRHPDRGARRRGACLLPARGQHARTLSRRRPTSLSGSIPAARREPARPSRCTSRRDRRSCSTSIPEPGSSAHEDRFAELSRYRFDLAFARRFGRHA